MKKTLASLILGALMMTQIPLASASTQERNVWLADDTRGILEVKPGDQHVRATGFNFRANQHDIVMKKASFVIYVDETRLDHYKTGEGWAHVDQQYSLEDVIAGARLVNEKGRVLSIAQINAPYASYSSYITFSNINQKLLKGKKEKLYVELDLKEDAPAVDIVIDIMDASYDLDGRRIDNGEWIKIGDGRDDSPNHRQSILRVL